MPYFNTGLNISGKVGIGTTTPSDFLTIGESGQNSIAIRDMRTIASMETYTSGAIKWHDYYDNAASIYLLHNGWIGNNARKLVFELSGSEKMRIDNNGNIGVGTTTPAEKLSVNGKIRAHEIKVETSNWPDYVFEPSYNRPSLSELETFIKVNKHLPEIPSAKEVEENGVSLGEMNAKLLKKIEELTLHLIEHEHLAHKPR